jgi:hypothetical protein
MSVDMSKCEWAWAIAHDRGLMHINWLVGGPEAPRPWPGAYDCGLFGTRREARKVLRLLLADRGSLPFKARVVKIHLAVAGA